MFFVFVVVGAQKLNIAKISLFIEVVVFLEQCFAFFLILKTKQKKLIPFPFFFFTIAVGLLSTINWPPLSTSSILEHTDGYNSLPRCESNKTNVFFCFFFLIVKIFSLWQTVTSKMLYVNQPKNVFVHAAK